MPGFKRLTPKTWMLVYVASLLAISTVGFSSNSDSSASAVPPDSGENRVLLERQFFRPAVEVLRRTDI